MSHWHSQGVRFAVVGLTSNVVLYLAYLTVTYLGVGHKLAMTFLYIVGVVQTFVLNRRWSFQSEGDVGWAFGRYVVVYASGYLLNLVTLYVFVNRLLLPHAVVQAFAIVTIAVFLFLGQRYWVFRPRRPGAVVQEAQ